MDMDSNQETFVGEHDEQKDQKVRKAWAKPEVVKVDVKKTQSTIFGIGVDGPRTYS